jgi:hypothetical protein
MPLSMFNPNTLSEAEIDQYSFTHHIASGLDALGWSTVMVNQVRDGWPEYSEIAVPGVYVSIRSSTPAGFELGSHGKSRAVEIAIYGENDAQRIRLAETIENIIRGEVPIYNFITGNEDSPTIDDYFVTDDVGWDKIPSLSITPVKQRYRSIVSATVRRVVDA